MKIVNFCAWINYCFVQTNNLFLGSDLYFKKIIYFLYYIKWKQRKSGTQFANLPKTHNMTTQLQVSISTLLSVEQPDLPASWRNCFRSFAWKLSHPLKHPARPLEQSPHLGTRSHTPPP